MPNLESIFRYPVKSMGGHQLNKASLGEWGIPGDRAWAVKDEAHGDIKGGKRFPQLMAMSARFLAEPDASTASPEIEITLPDDSTVRSSDADVNQKLTQAVGSPLSLWPLLPAEQLDHYRRAPAPPDADIEAGLRETFARTSSEPLPDLSGFPKALFEFSSPPGTYFDAYPILLMTTGALRTMQTRSNSSDQIAYDLRRFRPNLLIDLDGEFPENDWVGKSVQIGTVTLKVEMTCPRCIMTTHGFRNLAKEPKVMRELVKQNNGDLGVYCTITTPGELKVGDPVNLI